MPNWTQVLMEIQSEFDKENDFAFDAVRRKYLRQLQEYTGRSTIAYYSGWLSRRVDSAGLNDEDKNGFMLCVHEMPKDKGLDLILHTPGGAVAPTVSIIHYLKEMFGHDVRAIIPQIAMSAGTLIACSCKSIIMGKQSSLGPTDPQINGLPAFAIKKEFQRAYDEILKNPQAAYAWQFMLRQLNPTILQECDYAIDWTKEIIGKYLVENMLNMEEDANQMAEKIVKTLHNLDENKTHEKHFHLQECEEMGLKIEKMEDDQQLQDLILTTHHCFMHTFSSTKATKIIEAHDGKAFIKLAKSE